MTLDEAIEHCKEVMENKNKTLLKYFDRLTYDSIENCNKCIDEHMQLIKWLEELKAYREVKIIHCKDCKHWGTGIAGETENVKCCEYGKYMVGENGYCCYAEKERAE